MADIYKWKRFSKRDEGRSLALSKDERAAIRSDMLRDPKTPAHVKEKLLHEDRMEFEGRRNRRRPVVSVQERVDAFYAEHVPEIDPPIVVMDRDADPDVVVDWYCSDGQVAVHRAVFGVVDAESRPFYFRSR
ncbi:hypothetical protein [Gordonia humi]|uniref:Uncharacterized protein n=1 Tax=Gordonia humi TaxID=686429 RepID=A0A840ESH2_9ACTN|nr:hypothetical protein [Gordonia humi]MBB4134632.1 hypothetical protein [Gordonia humi]